MSPNINNEETCQLSSSTEGHVERLLAIGRRCASTLGDGPSAVEHGDFLYDERGLPK